MIAEPITLSQTNAGTSTVAAVSFMTNPFNVGLGAVVTGSPVFTIQYTFDDPMSPNFNAATANWFSSSLTAAGAVSLTVPCRGVRINVASGAGSVTLYVQQSGTR